MHKITYIFPVHNEAKYLEKQINLFLKHIENSNIPSGYILLVENGSSDKSWNICKSLEKKYKIIMAKQIAVGSYGLAVKHGMQSAQSKILVLLNVDFFDISFIQKALQLIKNHNIVVGSKNHKESLDQRVFSEKMRTRVFSFLLTKLFKYSGTDTHGIKVFKNTQNLKDTINSVISKHELFDTELLLKLKEKTAELPINIKELRPTRYSSINRTKRLLIDITRLYFFSFFRSKEKTYIRYTTADDYGINKATNSAILDLYKSKQVRIISVLPNMISKKAITELKKKVKNSDISAHISLVRGKPLSLQKDVQSLVDKNGNFHTLPIFLLKLFLKQLNLSEVEFEILKQLSFLKKQNIYPKYINSEQHTHIYPPIFTIFKKIAKKNNIKYIRNIKDVQYNLSWKLHKLFILKVSLLLSSYIYGKKPEYNTKIIEKITHPGSNFD